MTAKRLLPLLILVLAVGLPAYGAVTKTTPTTVPTMAPKATELLRQMSEYMRGLDQFQVHVETTREGILPTGQELDSDQAFELYVQRPDHFRIDHGNGAGDRQLFYDGKTLTIFTPKKNVYAVVDAPPTIAETVRAVRQRGIDLPLADFLAGHPAQTLTKNVTRSMYVGKSLVRGVQTNQLAFRQKDIDWQVWIEDSDTPFPVKIMILDKTVRGTPKFTVVMTDWDTTPVFDAGTFTFVPPEGAQKIKFREMPRPLARPARVK